MKTTSTEMDFETQQVVKRLKADLKVQREKNEHAAKLLRDGNKDVHEAQREAKSAHDELAVVRAKKLRD